MRNIYRKIAKKHGITAQEVKRNMQEAVKYAYRNAPDDGITKAYQNAVPKKGEIPTSEEFIRFAAKNISKK